MCSSHALGRHLLCLQSKSQCSSGLILISGRVNGARTLHVQRTHSDSCSKVSRRCRCRTRRCCSQPRHCQYTTAVSFSSLVSCHRGKEQLRWRHARGSSMRDLVLPPPKRALAWKHWTTGCRLQRMGVAWRGGVWVWRSWNSASLCQMVRHFFSARFSGRTKCRSRSGRTQP